MFIIVVGGGRLGTLLATKLKVDGNQVTIIDKSASTCNTVAENIRGVLVIQGDATDPAVLKEAKIEKADVLVCTTSFDEDNIVVCNIAKEMFNIKRTVSAVNNPQHLALYKYMNVDAPIDATAILARVVEE
jgi:trk system potassium uptake protein TrkA